MRFLSVCPSSVWWGRPPSVLLLQGLRALRPGPPRSPGPDSPLLSTTERVMSLQGSCCPCGCGRRGRGQEDGCPGTEATGAPGGTQGRVEQGVSGAQCGLACCVGRRRPFPTHGHVGSRALPALAPVSPAAERVETQCPCLQGAVLPAPSDSLPSTAPPACPLALLWVPPHPPRSSGSALGPALGPDLRPDPCVLASHSKERGDPVR